MTFQASDLKGKQFLDLLDGDNNIIEPSYAKEGSWLKVFSHSNSLCTHASCAITNYAPIGKYRLRFFPRKEFKCLCRLYPIKSRHYILHEYGRFNGYWNPRRDSLGHFVMFLVANLSTFAFTDNIPLSAMSRSHNQFPESSLNSSSSFFSFSLFSLCLHHHVSLLLLYVVMMQLLQSALMLCVINC